VNSALQVLSKVVQVQDLGFIYDY